MRRIDSIGALRDYLNSDGFVGSTHDSHSEGLLLLAHQADGNLWFEGNGDVTSRLDLEQNRRIFARGSVALIGACQALNPKADNQTLVDKLNRNGIDAMVASPYAVKAKDGVELSKALLKRIVMANSQGESPTIAELFRGAVQDMSLAPNGMDYAQRALEFVLLGNKDIRLCP
jgi:hypothetical protein